MIFFDKSYVDMSLQARLHRQKRQFSDIIDKYLIKIHNSINIIKLILFYLRDILKNYSIKNDDLFNQERWQHTYFNSPNRMCWVDKEDLTVDGYINKYGGIKSNIDQKIYTNKSSYMNHIKQNGKTIKDWS